jgi:hypothetical protein
MPQRPDGSGQQPKPGFWEAAGKAWRYFLNCFINGFDNNMRL